MSDVGSDSTFRDEWLAGAARAFFVSAYADYVEEGHSTDNELTDDERKERLALPRAMMGSDWNDAAPVTTPPNAYACAGELWARLERDNGCSLYVLAMRAACADDPCPMCMCSAMQDNCKECGGRGSVGEVDAEAFGSDLAMQALGSGVSWFDDHERFDLKVPHMDCGQVAFSDSAYTKR